MKLIRKKFRARDGTQQTAAKYYLEFRDHAGRRRTWAMHDKKKVSEGWAAKIDALMALMVNSEPLTAELSKWLEGIPQGLRAKLAQVGLIPRQRASSGQGFDTHIESFKRSLRRIGRTDKYVNLTDGFIKRTIKNCDFHAFGDIENDPIEVYLESMQQRQKNPISKRTMNAYIKAIKQFCTWAEKNRLITVSPIRHLMRFRADRR